VSVSFFFVYLVKLYKFQFDQYLYAEQFVKKRYMLSQRVLEFTLGQHVILVKNLYTFQRSMKISRSIIYAFRVLLFEGIC
jgi:hypothetical protein